MYIYICIYIYTYTYVYVRLFTERYADIYLLCIKKVLHTYISLTVNEDARPVQCHGRVARARGRLVPRGDGVRPLHGGQVEDMRLEREKQGLGVRG